jgi:integrase
MQCDCKIWIEGRLPNGDIVERQSTGHRTLPEAEGFRALILRDAARDVPHDVYGCTLAECIKKYCESRRRELGPKTLRQTEVVLERLRVYCATRDAFYMGNLNVDLVEDFKVYGLPEDMEDTSRATQIAKVICFLREAFRRSWIREALAEKVRPHHAVYEQKEGYSQQEVESILAEAEKLNGGTHGFAAHPQTFRLLLELMLETGLRVGDALQYDPRAAQRSQHLWRYDFLMQKRIRVKQPKYHEVYLTDRLKMAIDQCAWLSPKRPFIWGDFRNPSYLANEVYERMQTIGQRSGVSDCRPHRLRDTFAIGLLLEGLGIDDVSRLLGHSSVKVTEAYYAKWVTARKHRLEGLLAQALNHSSNRGVGDA